MSKLKYIVALSLMAHGLLAFQNNPHTDSLKSKPYITLNQSLVLSAEEELPYWFVSNNSRRLQENNYLGTWTSIGLLKQADRKGLSYFYGLELNAFAGTDPDANITQGYAGFKWKKLQFSGGLQEEFFGINDSTLSIGNLFYGNNARPIPKIVLSTTDWLDVPFSNGLLSFKGYWAHGWLEQDRFQSGALLHQKYGYFRINLFENNLHLIGGLHHAAQWGGENENTGAKQPATLIDFARVFIAKNGGTSADENDRLNALGNHLGTSDLRASLKLQKFTISNYWQFLWEDRSGLTPFNWRDGLFGISIKSNSKQGLITEANFEIIRTNHQDAFKTNELGDAFLEPDNFFNNSVYKDGWTYQNRVLANPVFISLNSSANSSNRVFNRVNGVNAAVKGIYKKVSYVLRVRHFKNSGTHFESFTPRLRLTNIEGNLQLPVKNAKLIIRGALELGNYPGNNAGLIITYSRLFNLKK